MFIIFGVSRKVARMAAVLTLCGSCHTPAARVVLRVRSYFTVMMLPLVPLGTRYRATCTLCGTSSAITPDEAEHAVRAQALHRHFDRMERQKAPDLPHGYPPPPAEDRFEQFDQSDPSDRSDPSTQPGA